MKQRTTMLLNTETREQLDWLARNRGTTLTEIVAVAIDRMFQQERAGGRASEQIDHEQAEINRLIATLSEANKMYLFVALPMQTGEDGPTVEAFIVDVWKQPVTMENMREFRAAFAEWVNHGYH